MIVDLEQVVVTLLGGFDGVLADIIITETRFAVTAELGEEGIVMTLRYIKKED